MDADELLKQINKDYTNAKLAVLFFGLTILMAAAVPADQGATFSFLVWIVFGVGAAIIGALTYFERK